MEISDNSFLLPISPTTCSHKCCWLRLLCVRIISSELLLGWGIEPIGDDWVKAEVGLGRGGWWCAAGLIHSYLAPWAPAVRCPSVLGTGLSLIPPISSSQFSFCYNDRNLTAFLWLFLPYHTIVLFLGSGGETVTRFPPFLPPLFFPTQLQHFVFSFFLLR